MPSMKEIEAKLNEIMTSRNRYQQVMAEIKDDRDLTDEAKRTRAQEAYRQATETHHRLLTEYREAVSQVEADLVASLSGPKMGAFDVYDQARDRRQRHTKTLLELDGVDLAKALNRATMSEDRATAAAITALAIESKQWDVARSAAELAGRSSEFEAFEDWHTAHGPDRSLDVTFSERLDTSSPRPPAL